jgi:NADH:ubiquinone oxidoreductase subunit F (NADH-binding)
LGIADRPARGPDPAQRLAARLGRDLGAVADRLRDAAGTGAVETATPQIAAELGLPVAAVRGPATFYADFTAPRAERHVRVCGAAACVAASAGRHLTEIEEALGVARGRRRPDGRVSLQEVRCLGYCYAGPAALDDDRPCAGPDLVDQLTGAQPPRDPAIPVRAAGATPVVTAGLAGELTAWSVWPAVAAGGDPDAVLAEVAAAGLRGRGGAGFQAARKWSAARQHAAPRVVVANGDEGDPGSYVDRLLMEQDPSRVLEGLALACFAVGAEEGVVFVRAEYPRARERMTAAIRAAYDDGHLGRDVHGTGRVLEVRVRSGAGSYVSGEETALLNALEGLRGVVRPRPPYPAERGLHGWPTVVNNVETLAGLPWILRHGGAAYARMGTATESGTVVTCLSERFARPGAYEVEIGTPLRRVVEDLGGGLRDGAVLRAIQVGGPLGGFLGPDDLDLPLSEAALSRHQAALGHAGIVALDDRLSGAEVMRHLWRFAAMESCGGCSPCRVGAPRGLALAGRPPTAEVVEAHRRVLATMETASLCAFGRRVPAALRSLVRVYDLEEWA